MFSIHSLASFFEEAAYRKHSDLSPNYPSDIFYQLSYLNLMEYEQDGVIYIASYIDNTGSVYYPFVLRPIQSSNSIISGIYYDIITPFEYGGPFLFPKDNHNVMRDFLKALTNYCKAENIVSEFIRMHPFLCKKEWLEADYDILENCQNIYVDLLQTPAEIFSNFSAATRRNIRVASRQGIVIERTNLQDSDVFKELYLKTMDRLEANQNYYFSNRFFSSLKSAHKIQFKIYNACKKNGDVVASVLFVGNGKTIHYFLGGRADLPRKEYVSNDFLFYEAICDAIDAGFCFFHLGGAGKGQGGLLRFKSGFSTDRIPYYTARKIHNPKVYQMLTNEVKPENAPQANFFPAYR